MKNGPIILIAKRGRPTFKPTAKQRREVEEMVSCGMSEDAVARCLGIATTTVRAHFTTELLVGRDKRRGEVIKLLYRAARKNNVAAIKKLEDMTSHLPTFFNELAADVTEPRQRKLGKKEEADIAANNPDASTPLGDLIARRMAGRNQIN